MVCLNWTGLLAHLAPTLGACTSSTSPLSPHRTGPLEQARNVTADLDTRIESLRFLLRDRDDKYSPAFDAIFEAEQAKGLKTAPGAPRMNAQCERQHPA